MLAATVPGIDIDFFMVFGVLCHMTCLIKKNYILFHSALFNLFMLFLASIT